MCFNVQNARWFFPATMIYVDNEGRRFDLITEMKGEMASFPRARWDDILDTLSRVYEANLYLTFPLPKVNMAQKAIRAQSPSGTNWEDF